MYHGFDRLPQLRTDTTWRNYLTNSVMHMHLFFFTLQFLNLFKANFNFNFLEYIELLIFNNRISWYETVAV